MSKVIDIKCHKKDSSLLFLAKNSEKTPCGKVSIQGVKSLLGGSRRFSEIGHQGH